MLIVGTDLKQLERVAGRLTRGRVAMGGLLSGMWLGLFVGMIFALFDQQATPFASILLTVAFGAVFGLMWAPSATRSPAASATSRPSRKWSPRSTRSSSSTSSTRGRELLAQMDPMRAAQAEVRAARERETAAQQAAQAQTPSQQQPPTTG